MQATATTRSQIPYTRRGGRCTQSIGPSRQRGVVLAVGLVILVVMTLLGVTAMRSSTVEEIMAGNLKDRNIAFQGAEAALRAGEAALQSGTTTASTALPNPATWDGQSPAATGALDTAGWSKTMDEDGVDQDYAPHEDPVYFLGPPFQARSTDDASVADGGEEFRTIYPVTAYSPGATASAVVILQSYYEPW
jgi:type IV pilus assembly protein PilX